MFFDTIELHMELHTLSRQWSTWWLDCLKRSENWTRGVKVFQIRPGVTISLWKCSNYPTYEDEDIKKNEKGNCSVNIIVYRQYSIIQIIF
jgi:hypothetical protein